MIAKQVKVEETKHAHEKKLPSAFQSQAFSPIHSELPVALSRDRQIREIARVIAWIGASQKDLPALLATRIPIQPEREHILLDHSLRGHVVEHSLNTVDRDASERHAQNAVELGHDKGDARLVRRLGKELLLDGQTGDVDAVLAQEAGQTSCAVLDGEGRVVLDVGG